MSNAQIISALKESEEDRERLFNELQKAKEKLAEYGETVGESKNSNFAVKNLRDAVESLSVENEALHQHLFKMENSWQNNDNQSLLDELVDQLNKSEKDREQLQSTVKQLEQQLREDILRREKALGSPRKEKDQDIGIIELREQNSRLLSEVESCVLVAENLKNKNAELRSINMELECKNSELNTRYAELQAKYAELQGKYMEVGEKQNKLSEQHKGKINDELVTQARGEIDQLCQENDRLIGEVMSLKRQLEYAPSSQTIQQLEAENAELRAEISKLNSHSTSESNLKETISFLEQELAHSRSDYDRLHSELMKAQAQPEPRHDLEKQSELLKQLESLRGERDGLERLAGELQERVERNQREHDDEREKILELTGIARTKSNIDIIQAVREVCVRNAKLIADNKQLEKEVDEEREETTQLIYSLRDGLTRAKSDIDRLSSENQRLRNQSSSFPLNNDETPRTLDYSRVDGGRDLNREILELQKSRSLLASQLESQSKELERLRRESSSRVQSPQQSSVDSSYMVQLQRSRDQCRMLSDENNKLVNDIAFMADKLEAVAKERDDAVRSLRTLRDERVSKRDGPQFASPQSSYSYGDVRRKLQADRTQELENQLSEARAAIQQLKAQRARYVSSDFVNSSLSPIRRTPSPSHSPVYRSPSRSSQRPLSPLYSSTNGTTSPIRNYSSRGNSPQRVPELRTNLSSTPTTNLATRDHMGIPSRLRTNISTPELRRPGGSAPPSGTSSPLRSVYSMYRYDITTRGER